MFTSRQRVCDAVWRQQVLIRQKNMGLYSTKMSYVEAPNALLLFKVKGRPHKKAPTCGRTEEEEEVL